jgi:hypothetical protein
MHVFWQALLRAFEDQLIRLTMGKTQNASFVPGVHTGKFTEEKCAIVKDAWVRWVIRSLPAVDVLSKVDYVLVDKGDGPGGGAIDKDEAPNVHNPRHMYIVNDISPNSVGDIVSYTVRIA